jgi:hypothetical protein
MDAIARHQHHARMRVLPHVKKLDDALGDFLVRVVCECGACREIQPQALVRLVGWKVTLTELAPRMRCSQCGRRSRWRGRGHGVAGGERPARPAGLLCCCRPRHRGAAVEVYAPQIISEACP